MSVAKRRILIVDDDETDLLTMQLVLEAGGYQVIAIQDGEEALREARRQRPDLIIVDLLMPPPDGFEVCRLMDEDAVLKSVPRIAVTALGEKMHKGSKTADVQLRLYADLTLDKPVDPKELTAQVRGLLEAKNGAS